MTTPRHMGLIGGAEIRRLADLPVHANCLTLPHPSNNCINPHANDRRCFNGDIASANANACFLFSPYDPNVSATDILKIPHCA